MAILKSIPIHNVQGIVNCLNYTTDEGKTTIFENEDGTKTRVQFDKDGRIINGTDEISSNVEKALAYAENIEKTAFTFDGDEDILVSGHNCSVESAAFEFMNLRYDYEESLRNKGIDPASRIKGKKNGTGKMKGALVAKEAREAYHFIMSFSERPDLTPQLVHKIGMEFCERAFSDSKAVISTHMNTKHLHNHIVRSAYNMSSATKYKDNMASLNELREICNEISLKYGLDILIDTGRDDIKGNTYVEKLELERGRSWKELLKLDIAKTVETCGSWKEFKQKMTEKGYGITEKPGGCVYYFLNDEDRRIRDNNLGNDFTRDFIKQVYGELIAKDTGLSDEEKSAALNEERRIREEAAKQNTGSKIQDFKNARNRETFRRGLNIYVARYTPTGRRRSDMELVFTAAIKLLKQYKDTNTEQNKEIPYSSGFISVERKLKTMNDNLNMSIGLGITDEEHLKKLKNTCGAKKSSLESDIKSVEQGLKASVQLCDKVKSVKKLQEIIKERGLDNVDICVLIYEKSDIQANRAKLQPMSPKQRKELFVKLKDKGYRVTTKYDHISYSEAKQILDYLKGKVTEKPEILVTESEFEEYKKARYQEKIAETSADNVRFVNNSNEGFNGLVTNDTRNALFEKSIENLPAEDQEYLYKYRILVNELASLGYSLNDLQQILEDNKALAKTFNSMSEEIRELRYEYRNLSRLEYNYKLAKDRTYTHNQEEEKKEPKKKVIDKNRDNISAKEPVAKVKKGHVPDKTKTGSREETFAIDDAYFEL